MIKYLVLPIFLSSITVSPVLGQSTAVIFAPPSNVRNAPDGETEVRHVLITKLLGLVSILLKKESLIPLGVVFGV